MIEQKMKLYPTLSNLLNDEVYIYKYNDEDYYIPYWHHELIYDVSFNSLIFQCEPKLPDYINIDKFNNLYISINTNIKDVLNTNNIDITISNTTYTIPICDLKIKKLQRYIFKSCGISKINIKNIYCNNERADIYIDILFNDIN